MFAAAPGTCGVVQYVWKDPMPPVACPWKASVQLVSGAPERSKETESAAERHDPAL